MFNTLSQELRQYAGRHPRRARFAECLAQGMPAAESYREAGYAAAGKAASARAERLARLPEIVKLVQAIQELAVRASLERAVLSVQEKREFLARVVRTPAGAGSEAEVKIAEKIRAIELDAKLAGDLKEAPEGTHSGIGVISAESLPALQVAYWEMREALLGEGKRNVKRETGNGKRG